MSKQFQISLAPQELWQAINPWTFNQQRSQFGLININLGQTPDQDGEQEILDRVGSYGRQLGRIGDALEVLLNHLKLDGLSPAEQDALLRLASASAMAGDSAELHALGLDGAPRVSGPRADMFRLLTEAPVSGVADLGRSATEVALARALPAGLAVIGTQ